MPPQPIGGRYRVLEPLARYGPVATFAAEDLWLHRRIGLSLHDGESELDRMHFERAAEALASSWRRGALPLYDLGAERQQRFVTFDLPRETLASSLSRGPGDAGAVRALALALAATIGDLHERGAVHGRLHPGAVCLGRTGEPQLAPAPVAPAPPGWGGETAWVASEQLAAPEPTVEGDVWALGALLLSALVGTGPGPLGEEATAELAEHLRRSNDPELIGLIARCMAAEPSRRPGSMLAVAGALGASAPPDARTLAPPEPEPRAPVAAAVRRRRVASPAVLGAVVACTTLAASLSVVVDHTGDAPALPTGCSAATAADRTCAAAAHGASAPGSTAPGSTTAATIAPAPKVTSGTAATLETPTTPATATTLANATTATTRNTGTTAAGAPAITAEAPGTATTGSAAATAATTMSTSGGTRAGRFRRADVAQRVVRRRAVLGARARDRRLRVERLLARSERVRAAASAARARPPGRHPRGVASGCPLAAHGDRGQAPEAASPCARRAAGRALPARAGGELDRRPRIPHAPRAGSPGRPGRRRSEAAGAVRSTLGAPARLAPVERARRRRLRAGHAGPTLALVRRAGGRRAARRRLAPPRTPIASRAPTGADTGAACRVPNAYPSRRSDARSR